MPLQTQTQTNPAERMREDEMGRKKIQLAHTDRV